MLAAGQAIHEAETYLGGFRPTCRQGDCLKDYKLGEHGDLVQKGQAGWVSATGISDKDSLSKSSGPF